MRGSELLLAIYLITSGKTGGAFCIDTSQVMLWAGWCTQYQQTRETVAIATAHKETKKRETLDVNADDLKKKMVLN